MKALFCNVSEPACGVFQFGENLFGILRDSSHIEWRLHHASDKEAFMELAKGFDAVLYNYSSLIASFVSVAPFAQLEKPQFLIFHDAALDESRWDGIFFSDPTLASYGKWHVFGRPLPESSDGPVNRPNTVLPVIGSHGFIGAWADLVVQRVKDEFHNAQVRLNLPFAKHVDADGAQATAMAERCRAIASDSGIELFINHSLLPPFALLDWLRSNDMNVYLRPTDMNWRGVASAPDFALAADRPIAVNRCNAFRHLHNLDPSICIEDRNLLEIFEEGIRPFQAFKNRWCDPEIIRRQIENVIVECVS